MRKKILLAENSDAIRTISESILHQNGYDVISASNVEKAKELIITSQPNMVIVGADLKGSDGKYLYDSLEENKTTSALPILLIADPDGRSLPYPDEVILPRPFDPKDFVERVRLFVGGGIEPPQEDKVQTIEPFPVGSIDDEFLDAALGIDRIEVENSEIMDKTSSNLKADLQGQTSKKDIFEIHRPEQNDSGKVNDNDKVESLLIREESQSVKEVDKPKQPEFSASSKLEIPADQYGLLEPAAAGDVEPRDVSHDYNWFINEMQKEVSQMQSLHAGLGDDSQRLKTIETRETLEPVMPPSPVESDASPIEMAAKPQIKGGGVDQFISEFKKEAERISAQFIGEPTKSEMGREETASCREANTDHETASTETHLFINNLIEVLSEKLAKKIVDRIDREELYRIIKKDLTELIALRK